MEKISSIKEQFNKVIEYSQEIENCNSDELFSQWYEAKKKFIENYFNGALIAEYPEEVSFELDDVAKKERIDDFIQSLRWNYGLDNLADFVDDNRDGFFANRVINGTKEINEGMKLVKAFKFFIPNEDRLNLIQSEASRIIQENKIKGTLCFSVHPLDFLSLSENTHNWRSCHALDGEYRGGNLSYMVDEATVICYLKSTRDEVLPNFPPDIKWNSKKWRVLFYVSPNAEYVFAGRQYPFSTENGINFIKDIFMPKMGFPAYIPWSNEKIKAVPHKTRETSHLHSSYVPMGGELFKLSTLIKDGKNALQFNDVLHSTCYDPMYTIKGDKTWFGGDIWREMIQKDKGTTTTIGGECKCLLCNNEPIESSTTVLCNHCELKYGRCDDDIFEICPICDEYFIYDEGYWVEGEDETICPDCALHCVTECDCCGVDYYNEHLHYNERIEEYECENCREYKEELMFNV